MIKWEQHGDKYYYSEGGWEYMIRKTEYGWTQYAKRVGDGKWDEICSGHDLADVMEAQ